MNCPACDHPLGSLATLLSRARRAKLKAEGKCECGAVIPKHGRFSRCFECRRVRAIKTANHRKL